MVTSTERKYVIRIKDGKTLKADVITGGETKNKVEIFGKIIAGDSVILQANDEIKEGLAIH